MPINPDALGAEGSPVESSWNSKDCLLYALGVGAGMDDPVGSELEFTTEN
ncbi:MAG: enoyl-CoA hydratase, partial [Chloroflexi bacterium]|nr:enoyl-CoA hydratase [Chloroflexota bacterium]